MGRYRKRPVEVDAVSMREVLGDAENNWLRLPAWLRAAYEQGDVLFLHHPDRVTIRTLEGTMIAQPDDWIIRGVKGELYPCKADIFEATYLPIDA